MGAVPVLSLRALASDECDAHVAKCPRVSKDAATASSSSFLEALRHHRYCVISCDIDADEGNGTSLPLANAIAQSYEAGCTFFGLAASVREEYTELKAQQRDCYGCDAHSVRSKPHVHAASAACRSCYTPMDEEPAYVQGQRQARSEFLPPPTCYRSWPHAWTNH